jgi:hypothetical protein
MTEHNNNNQTHNKTSTKQQHVPNIPRNITAHQKQLAAKQDGKNTNNENHYQHTNLTTQPERQAPQEPHGQQRNKKQ